jgi:hypothetical protein
MSAGADTTRLTFHNGSVVVARGLSGLPEAPAYVCLSACDDSLLELLHPGTSNLVKGIVRLIDLPRMPLSILNDDNATNVEIAGLTMEQRVLLFRTVRSASVERIRHAGKLGNWTETLDRLRRDLERTTRAKLDWLEHRKQIELDCADFQKMSVEVRRMSFPLYNMIVKTARSGGHVPRFAVPGASRVFVNLPVFDDPDDLDYHLRTEPGRLERMCLASVASLPNTEKVRISLQATQEKIDVLERRICWPKCPTPPSEVAF